MSRPRSFDEEMVIQIAMGEFLRDGFDAVTFRSLADKTGLGLRSLSNAFGDKEALFIRVMEAYVTRVENTLPDINPPTGPEAIAKLFALMTAQYPADAPRQNGCLVINQITDARFHDERLEKLIDRYRDSIAQNFSAALAAGNIRDDDDDKVRFLMTLYVGVLHTIRLYRDTRAPHGIAAHVAALLESWK